ARLEAAIEAYRQCLNLTAPDGGAEDRLLHADARFNLELARLLWLQAKAEEPEEPSENSRDGPPDSKKGKKAESSKEDSTAKTGTKSNDDGNDKNGAAEPG